MREVVAKKAGKRRLRRHYQLAWGYCHSPGGPVGGYHIQVVVIWSIVRMDDLAVAVVKVMRERTDSTVGSVEDDTDERSIAAMQRTAGY
jgi:hypothetical protein